jgi:hypothetical protein
MIRNWQGPSKLRCMDLDMEFFHFLGTCLPWCRRKCATTIYVYLITGLMRYSFHFIQK